MDSGIIITSIGIGAGIFVSLIIFWFFHKIIKRRLSNDQSLQAINRAPLKSGRDQRRHPRIAVSWSASMEFGQMVIEVRLKDISLGGAFVICQEPVPLDEKLRIYIEVPNQDRFALNAEVVWSNMNVPEEKVVNRGMGIRFIDNDESHRRKLNDALSAALEDGADDI